MEPSPQGHDPRQLARHTPGPLTLPQGVSVRNTFLEFHEEAIEEGEEDDEDPWVQTPGRARRLQTDSVVERSSQSLRFSLEQNIGAALDAQRLSALTKGGDNVSQPVTVGTIATPLGETQGSEASSLPATWASEAEEEAAQALEDMGSVAQDFARTDWTSPPAKVDLQPRLVLTTPTGSVQNQEASVASSEGTDGPDQQALSVNLSEPLVLPANTSLEGKTTVMVRNIPAKFAQQKLMREINAAGFLGKYDFLYLPMHPGGRGNRGFAFINFLSTEVAEAFKLAFGGSRFRHFNNSAPLAIVPADLQGFEENAAHHLGALRSASSSGRRAPPAGHAPLFFKPLPPHLDGSEFQHQHPECAAYPQDQIQQMPMLSGGAMPMPMVPPAAPAQRIPHFCAYCGGRRSLEHRFCAFCGAPCNPPAASGLTQ